MAKLMVHLSVAVWLTVSLAVLIRARSWRDALNLTPIEELERKESKDPGSLSDKELKRLANSYIKGLPKGTNIEAWDEEGVLKLIGKLGDLDMRYKQLELWKLEVSDSWQDLVLLRNSVSNCDKGRIPWIISEFVSESYKHLQDFALKYFSDYLKTCGPEEHFRKLVENINHQSIKQNLHEFAGNPKYHNLDSYLVAEFWPRVRSAGRWAIESTLNHLLQAIEELSELESISQEDCIKNTLARSIVSWLANITGCSMMRNVIAHYLALYLDTCGYQKRFEEMIQSSEQISDKASFSATHPTLYEYLRKEFLPKLRLTGIHDYTNDVEYLSDVDISIFSLTECTEEITWKFGQGLGLTKNYQKLQELIRYYFAHYLDKCGFEERFTDIKMQHKIFKNYGNLAKYVDGNFFTELESSWDMDVTLDLIKTLDAVDKLADLGRIDVSNCNKKTTDFIEELKFRSRYMGNLEQEIDRSALIADYMQGCVDHFKEMTKRFQEANQKEWAFIKESTSNLMKHMSENLQLAMIRVASEFTRTGAYDFHRVENFETEFKANCQVLMDYMHEAMYIMYYDVNLARKDKDILKFMDYLSCCSRVSGPPDTKWILIFTEIGAPFYSKSDL